ncbi:MAG: NAD-dependent protein deacylase [Lachnospiraceae bacterium]|nr:NAD-dependent protein deacylase [Lachnospiraceae bacterium]
MTTEEYQERVAGARRIVFFGGAGVSTESGIPDFRSVDGLYNRKYDVPPETILSADYFYAHTDLFYKFYFDKMIFRSAKPNAAHKKLARWECEGKLSAVITQNIDGLHQAAGSKNVFELHGTTLKNHCIRCGKKYSLEEICAQAPSVPKCDCGGTVKPDVVLYGEPLPSDAVRGAVDAIGKADMLIIGGTSLSVYPAASFIGYYRGNEANLIVINKTHIDNFANQLNGNLGELL